RSGVAQSAVDVVLAAVVAEEHDAPATPRAADLRGWGAGALRHRDQLVDDGRRDAGRERAAVLPLVAEDAAGGVEVALHDGLAHARRRVAYALEALVDLARSVDVGLEDLPVVRAGEV